MFIPRTIAPAPRLAYTDYTPPGPWTDGQTVVRNYDGVGFTYSASLNALTINPNLSASIKNANSLGIINVPDPTNNLDVANKEYVDSHAGSGGGIPDAPSDSTLYGRENAGWVHAVPLAGGTMTGLLTLSGVPSATNGAATKGYVDTAVPPSSTATPAMDGTGAAGTATAYSRGDHVHPTDTSRAPLASPIFTGTPQAPTPITADNSTDIATTAFVKAQGYATGSVPAPSGTTPIMDGTGAAGTATTYARGDHVHPSDTSRAPLASPTFTGTPAAPTPATADNSTTLATTAFVKAQGYLITNQTITLSGDISGSGTGAITTTLPTVNSNVGTFQGITVNGKGLVTGAVNQNYAPLASPTFTGTPAAPTPAVNDNTTKIATTAYVVGQAGTANPLMNGTVAVGTSLLYTRQDHVHPSDTSRAPNTVFVASGASHAQGLVPDPGATAGTARFLREDATWAAAGGSSLFIQDTAPTGASAGALWWNSTNGQLYAYYNDGTSIQWVCINPTASLAAIQYDILQSLSASQQAQARQNAGAAPFDAMMHNNIALNGAMEIGQESGGTVLTLVSGTSKYICDQWQGTYIDASAVVKGAQVTPVSGPAGLQTIYAMYLQATTAISLATSMALIQQPIEGLRFMRAQFGTSIATSVTISFWVNCTVAGTFSVTLRNGSAANRSYVTNLTYTSALGWQFFTVTIPGDTAGTWAKDNTWAVSLGFCFCCGTSFQTTAGAWQAGNFFGTSSNTNFFATANNIVYLTGVAVFIGTNAPVASSSGYLWRPYDEELRLCERYYWRTRSTGFPYLTGVSYTGTGYVATPITFPVTMRIAPTCNKLGTWNVTNCSQPAIQAAGNDGLMLYCQAAAAGNVVSAPADATCYVTADARL